MQSDVFPHICLVVETVWCFNFLSTLIHFFKLLHYLSLPFQLFKMLLDLTKMTRKIF